MLDRIVALALCMCLVAAPASAAGADFYRGQTLTYIVATGPGGVYDLQARLMARFLPKYLPVSRVLVKNVPGAGHIVGANTLYVSKPDGLTIATFNTGLIYDQLLGRPGARFDLKKMHFVAKATNDTRVLMVAANSGFKSFESLYMSPTPVKFGAAGIGSASYIETRIVEDALRLPLQLVTGFEGTEADLSMLRGEIVAQVGTAGSLEPFAKRGGGFFALVLSDTDTYPGIPRASAYAKDERGKRLLDLVSTLSQMGRLTAAPPGIPADRLAALRDAFFATMKDPGYVAEANKLYMALDPAHGTMVQAMVLRALNQPPETIAALKAAATK